MKAVDAELSPRPADVRFAAFGNVPAVHSFVYMVKDEQEKDHVKNKNREQAQAPEKRNAPHESHEQRRIADGRQDPSHIGDKEDEEHHDVRLPSSPGIHLQHGAHHEHTGAGRADAARQERAQDEKPHIDPRGSREIPLHSDIAGHAEQAEQQDDKGQIVVDRTLQHRFRRLSRPVEDGKGNDHGQDPEDHRMGLMRLPPFPPDQGHDSNAQKKPCKRDTEPDGDGRLPALSRRLRAQRAEQDQAKKNAREKYLLFHDCYLRN